MLKPDTTARWDAIDPASAEASALFGDIFRLMRVHIETTLESDEKQKLQAHRNKIQNAK